MRLEHGEAGDGSDEEAVQHVLDLVPLRRPNALAVEEHHRSLRPGGVPREARRHPHAVRAPPARDVKQRAAEVVQLVRLAHALLAQGAHKLDRPGV